MNNIETIISDRLGDTKDYRPADKNSKPETQNIREADTEANRNTAKLPTEKVIELTKPPYRD